MRALLECSMYLSSLTHSQPLENIQLSYQDAQSLLWTGPCLSLQSHLPPPPTPQSLAYYFSSLLFGVCVKLLQSCLTRCKPMDCSLPGSSVCGILQTRILEWVAMPSRESSWPRDQTRVSYVSWIDKRFFTTSITWEALRCLLVTNFFEIHLILNFIQAQLPDKQWLPFYIPF